MKSSQPFRTCSIRVIVLDGPIAPVRADLLPAARLCLRGCELYNLAVK
jgi:hypothetical protein